MREKSTALPSDHSSERRPASRLPSSSSCLSISAFCVLPFAFCFLFSSASAAERPMRLDVLRAEANGTILDVLLRVELPGVAEELRPRDVAVFIAPADLSAAAAATAQFRLPRLFLKRMGKAYYIDLRQLPAGVGAAACQLLLRIGRDGELVATHRLARLLGPPAEELDVALLIDESLSMRRTDPEKLRIAAAKTFVDLARRSTRIGRIAVVGFNNKARTLAPLTSPLQAESLYRAIDRAGAIGQTDMDSALDEAWKAFGHSPTAAKAVVLLTDGRDEPGRYENAHRRFAAQRWRVYTVGLSKRADTTVLQRIAHDTGGEYHNAPTNAELQDIFGRICLTLQKKVPIRSRRHDLPAGGLVADPFAVDDSISALTVSLKARDPDVAFSLLDPATRPLTPDVKGAGRAAAYDRKAAYQYYDLWSPAPGQWAARLQAPHAQGVTVAATAVTNLLLRAFPLQPTCYRGEPVELAASLAVADSVLGHAQVEARVTPADGTTTTVPLFDDGRHHDTDADDGVFAGLFPGTETPGPCTIRLVATGTTPAGHRFERELSLTTTVATEGYSKLWCANRSLDFGVLYSGETATRALDLKLTSALDAPIAETIRAALQPPARPDGKRLPDAALRLSPRPLSLETGRLASVTLALSVPHAQPAGRYRGQLELASKYDRVTIPIQAEVRHPRLVLSPESIDLGSLESGSRAEARFAMRLEPRGALEARATGSDPRLALAPQAATLGPKPTEVTIALAAPADLPSTTIRATVTVQTPLGQAQLPVKAKVVKPAFVVSPTQVDFGELMPGQAATRASDLRVTGLEPRRASPHRARERPRPDAPGARRRADAPAWHRGARDAQARRPARAAARSLSRHDRCPHAARRAHGGLHRARRRHRHLPHRRRRRLRQGGARSDEGHHRRDRVHRRCRADDLAVPASARCPQPSDGPADGRHASAQGQSPSGPPPGGPCRGEAGPVAGGCRAARRRHREGDDRGHGLR